MRRNQKIRLKANQTPRFFGEGQCISRQDALSRIRRHMETTAALNTETLRLIDLFQIEPEELLEAGLAYESLKALEQRALFL